MEKLIEIKDTESAYINYNMIDPIHNPPPGQPQYIRKEPKIGRNDICPKCDSGKKYKKCCINI
jgi:uncharacterized protein YecA (UPF0149 family)